MQLAISVTYIVISISHTIHRHLFSDFSSFHSPIKEKEKQWRMKGLTIGQWINLNRNNISVFAHQYSVLWKKTCPILSPLVGLTPTGKQPSKRNTGGFQNSLQDKLFRLLFCLILLQCYYYSVKTAFQSACQVKLILRCVLKCCHFFHGTPY